MVRPFTALDPVGQFIIVVGALLALLVLYDHLRRRGAPLEAALMFGAVAAGTFFLNQIHVAWMFALGAVLFLAKPYLLVRLLQNFRPVPVLGRRLIVAGMVASWLLAIAISPPPSPPSLPVQAAVLALIGYLVAVEAYAAVAFVRGALESPGVNRRRLTLATAGSALLGASAVLDGIRISLEGASVLSPTWQLILWPSVGLASLSYFLAFAPPSWLRQAWQMIELRRFLRQAAGMSAGVRADEAVNRLLAAAVRATGATTALVALWDEARQAMVVPARDTVSPELEFRPDESDIGRAWREKKAVSVQNLSELGTGGASLAGPDVGALFAIPIATNERTWGLLLVLLRRASLFPADDMVVLSLLADQSAIALANAELIAQLRALAATLRETNVELERASQAKSEFLASMSHELRTPMNAILGFTDALLAGVDGPLTDTQKESLGWVQRGGRDLLALINEVLDLSKIEAGKVVLKAELFAPAELIEGIVGQHRRLAEEKGLKFEWMDDGAPAQVNLDRQRTQQILVNLVGNALKFTPQGEVKLVASSTSDGGLRVVGHRARHRR